MSFISSLTTYIGSQTDLTVDTNLFVGGFLVSSPDESVAVTFEGGGERSESGMVAEIVHVLARSDSYEAAHDLAYKVFNVIKWPRGMKLALVRAWTGARTWAGTRTWAGADVDSVKVFASSVINIPYMFSRDGALFIFAFDVTIYHLEVV